MNSLNYRMKRVICFIMIALFMISVNGMNLQTVYGASYDYIKVGLRYSSGTTTATIGSTEGLSAGTASDGIYTEDIGLSQYSSVILTLADGNIVVSDADGNTLTTLTGDGTECLVSASGALSGTISFEDSSYRGGIIPYINASGQMNIINYLSLDDYVRGVVGSEIGSYSGAEALKAQAIAAKNYAATTTKHRSQGFDVCTTTNCQVYKGISGETDSINSAVDAISGKLMYCDGRLIEACFFSNSGGHTENSEDVWSTAYNYLRGVEDPYAPDYSWSTSLTKVKLTSMMTGYSLGEVTDVTVMGRNESGYVSALKITGTRASLTLQKDNIRTTLGGSVLKSRNFTVTGSSTAGSAVELYVYNGTSISKVSTALNILSASLQTESPLSRLYASNGTLKTAMAPSDTETSTGDSFTFTGKGYGHGVGMSQMSAQQMAKQGMTYDEILKYFYTGIEIK